MVRALSAQHTPMAWLSRAEVVQLGNMLVFALPGSPKAAAQCLDILAPVLGHALAMVEGMATDDCLQRGLAAPAGRGHAAAGRTPAAAPGRGPLARDIHSAQSLPPFDNSAMDGFALRANGTAFETGTEFAVQGWQAAGDAGADGGEGAWKS